MIKKELVYETDDGLLLIKHTNTGCMSVYSNTDYLRAEPLDVKSVCRQYAFRWFIAGYVVGFLTLMLTCIILVTTN